ncbi:MAG: phospholipid carrier-dependent glycosyltransferase [Mycobacteriaceae bacterium]
MLPSPAPRFAGPPTDTVRGWVVTGVITLLAAITRFVTLRTPTDGGTPVFDEKHYVPQAFQDLLNGGLEDNPGYELVVHPPVAKQLMALSEWAFGYNGFGWRFPSAVLGVLIVALLVRMVRRMTGSTMIGAIAGILATCDGVLFLQSRMGMLDIFLTFFVVAALACLLVDRDQVRARTAVVLAQGRVEDTPFGPRYGVRWWRFGAGVMLGLACGTKWNGVFFVAAFGLLSVGFDLVARRGAGVRRPWLGTLRRDVGPALYALVVVPLLVYLATFWAWFASETGIDRWAVGRQVGNGGTYSFVPDALRSLWYYSAHVLSFHEHLDTPVGSPHPYESKPWTWPMGMRPMLYYFANSEQVEGCGQSRCVSATMLVGTPAMWWLAFPVLGWALWRTVFHRDWRYTVALVGYGTAFLPWFTNLDRQMYFFYATVMAPFLVMAIALVLGDVLGRARAGTERRTTGLLVVCLYLGLVVANFVWLWPILIGAPITDAHWQAELWLPSWR